MFAVGVRSIGVPKTSTPYRQQVFMFNHITNVTKCVNHPSGSFTTFVFVIESCSVILGDRPAFGKHQHGTLETPRETAESGKEQANCLRDWRIASLKVSNADNLKFLRNMARRGRGVCVREARSDRPCLTTCARVLNSSFPLDT